MTDEHIRAKKSLGQNFLRDPHYLAKIIDAARIGPEDRVLEVGPGRGDLTRLLAERASELLVVELDDRLIGPLRSEFRDMPSVRIVHADALAFDLTSLDGTWKVVANLPYYISTALIQRFLDHPAKFSTLTLMLQREVAERVAAPPGGKEYGYLSVVVQYRAAPRIEFLVPPGAFTPRPKVESAVVTLTMLREPSAPVENENYFLRVVKAAFGQRRKTLRNSLAAMVPGREVLDAASRRAGIDLGRRPETLSVQEFALLAGALRSLRTDDK